MFLDAWSVLILTCISTFVFQFNRSPPGVVIYMTTETELSKRPPQAVIASVLNDAASEWMKSRVADRACGGGRVEAI
ncbi:hypothetical protein BGW80DRAFT_1282105 [Lactifluus volemus]|nr:hypothetical protein BGW80DRAFT_1282105 [Lactifluus volemus]